MVTGLCAGTYEVTITDSNGCISTVDVTILNTLGITELEGTTIEMFPNPSNGIVQINLSNDQLLGNEFSVLDNSGRLVYEGTLETLSTKVDLGGAANGVYFIQLEGVTEVFQLVKR